MSYGIDFNNDGKVDSTEEILTIQMTQRAYNNGKATGGGCLYRCYL
ncbi:MAG: hypothetical protein IKU54_04215 [Oscillospiraceae bacterium]|nr:hypothetical protein [Oscillospiraceae bacterium]